MHFFHGVIIVWDRSVDRDQDVCHAAPESSEMCITSPFFSKGALGFAVHVLLTRGVLVQ